MLRKSGVWIQRDFNLIPPKQRQRIRNPILYAGDLSLQYIVDQGIKVDNDRLNYLSSKKQQAKFQKQRRKDGHQQEATRTITNPDIKWIEGSVFNPEEEFSELMTNIASSEVLGVMAASQVSQQIREKFEDYKSELLTMRAPLSSNFFVSVDNNVRADVSKGMQNLVTVL